MNRKQMKGTALLVAMIAIMSVYVFADTQTDTVQFVIPSSVVHTVTFGTVDAQCGTGGSDMYFVESDGTKDGTQTQIGPSADLQGSNSCQNETVSAMTFNNGGTVAINVSALVASLDSGIELKYTLNYSGYEDTCSGPPATNTTCVDLSGSYQLIAPDIAYAGTEDVWAFVDMSNYNSGAATDGTQRTVTTNATAAS